MTAYKKLFTVALFLSLLAGLTSLLFPVWIVYMWIIIPLGIIAGFYLELKPSNQFSMVLVILFMVSASVFSSVVTVIPFLGTMISTFVEGLLLFIPAAYVTAVVRYFIKN